MASLLQGGKLFSLFRLKQSRWKKIWFHRFVLAPVIKPSTSAVSFWSYLVRFHKDKHNNFGRPSLDTIWFKMKNNLRFSDCLSDKDWILICFYHNSNSHHTTEVDLNLNVFSCSSFSLHTEVYKLAWKKSLQKLFRNAIYRVEGGTVWQKERQDGDKWHF